LALAVDPLGALYWQWLPNLKKEQIAQIVGEWREAGIEGLVWDHAPGYKARMVREVGMKLVPLPPYAPELNPAERIFEELQRSVEGHCYGRLEVKPAWVENELVALAADPGRVQQLSGWSWIRDALGLLPL
jgi:transposase